MYDSMTKHNFDRVSDAVDRVSDAVDSDLDKVETNSIKPTYDNASNTNTGSTKYDQNMKGAPKDNDTKDNVQNDRHITQRLRSNGPQRQMRLTIDT